MKTMHEIMSKGLKDALTEYANKEIDLIVEKKTKLLKEKLTEQAGVKIQNIINDIAITSHAEPIDNTHVYKIKYKYK